MFLAVLGSHAPGFGSGDSVRQKYAGMESDDATGMAHTLWRKQDNFSGRWTSPDPYGGSMTPANPQSFNRYTYCENDPVNQVDPLGLYPNNYHDATSRWEDVKGYFWGDGRFDTSNTRFSRGQRNIASAEYRHDSMVSQARALSAFWDAYDAHDHDGARAILDANPSIGYYEERTTGNAGPQDATAAYVDVVGGNPIGGANSVSSSRMQHEPVEGPFVVDNAGSWIGMNKLGDGDCVALPQQVAGLPNTRRWRQGRKVFGNTSLARGTVIATFVNGRYPNKETGNHAAMYMGQDANGIWVVDQYKMVTAIQMRYIRVKAEGVDRSNNATAFSVVLVRVPHPINGK